MGFYLTKFTSGGDFCTSSGTFYLGNCTSGVRELLCSLWYNQNRVKVESLSWSMNKSTKITPQVTSNRDTFPKEKGLKLDKKASSMDVFTSYAWSKVI